ncbi:unnamed protein product [Tetraodon nigroviridis]|uniref:(spotted green pufferfish) hypothetical protein n=1 Tax=Tetraodon nigroviridis TaxID=99883 RepID=Q4RGH1_TETNG|nr:unnamed protein product [Tetraodon nigroviridis]
MAALASPSTSATTPTTWPCTSTPASTTAAITTPSSSTRCRGGAGVTSTARETSPLHRGMRPSATSTSTWSSSTSSFPTATC